MEVFVSLCRQAGREHTEICLLLPTTVWIKVNTTVLGGRFAAGDFNIFSPYLQFSGRPVVTGSAA